MFAKIRRYLHRFFVSPVIAPDPEPGYSQADLADPKIAGAVAAKRAFSDAVTQYYWDVKMGFSQEQSLFAVPCPACDAGVQQPCITVAPGVDEWVGRLVHPERANLLGDVHEEFCQMDGRDRA